MKIVLFGLGSIGKRHARLLKERPGVELYAFRSKADAPVNDLNLPEIRSWEEVDALKPQVAFITNPTHLHVETATACAKRGMALFLEKPIGANLDGLDDLLQLTRDKKLTAYVAYVLRFHPEIVALKKKLESERIRHVRAICTSYLPEWRPGGNPQESYSASAQKGGGVILDVSHEFDYLTYLLGPFASITGQFGKLSDVTADAEDYVDAHLLGYAHPVNLHMNLFSRKTQRLIQVDTENGFLEVDLTKALADRDQIFRKQLDYFFDNLNNPALMNNLFEAGVMFRKLIAFKNS